MWLPMPQVEVDRTISGVFQNEVESAESLKAERSGAEVQREMLAAILTVYLWDSGNSQVAVLLTLLKGPLLTYNELNVINLIKRSLI